MNFTNDTNYLIFSSTHLTQFTSFFEPNNATFRTNNRFFYLKRPRILKFIPNYGKSWGFLLFLALLGAYLIFLCILAIYDSQYRNKEALLEYIKEEVIQFSLHYKKQEDKNDYIPNIFRKRYDYRYFKEMPTTNNRLTNVVTTNEDLKTTSQGFWKNDNENNNEEKFDEIDLDPDLYDENDNNQPKLRNNFFYLGNVRQKQLTVEQKLRQKNNNTYIYNKKKVLNDIKNGRRTQISNGQNRNENLRAELEEENEVKQQQLEEFASIDLTFFEFLLKNIVSRSIIINSYVIVSIFSPRWKKQSLLLTEHCIMIILLSILLTNDESITIDGSVSKFFIISVISMVCTDFFMYIFTFAFFSFPIKSQRRLYNLVINNHQLEILKEWEKTESRMRKFETIGMILGVLIWIAAFYISFGFTVVWRYQREAFLISFASTFGFNYVAGELLIEILIALLYLGRKHNSFLRNCAKGLNNLRNIRCLSP